MEEQLKVLNMYFKHNAIQFLEDPNEKDENLIEGEYWEFKDPEKVEAWGLMMIPNNNNFAFTYKFKNAQCFLNLFFLEKIKDIESDAHPTLSPRKRRPISLRNLYRLRPHSICDNAAP